MAASVIVVFMVSGLTCGQTELYARHETLQATMLATRARLHAWQDQQDATRQAVRVGSWHAATLQPGETLQDLVSAWHTASLPVSEPGGATSRWTACAQDAAGNPLLAGAPDVLCTTVASDAPRVLTLELSRTEQYGGFAYRPPADNAGVQATDVLVWLGGQPVAVNNRLAGYERVSVAKRRGWHEAILVDVPLAAGDNRLVVTLSKRDRKNWFTRVGLHPDPIPALWAMLEHDFPRAQHRLLDAVHYSWFDSADGWFSPRAELRYERQLLEKLDADLGADGAAIAERRRQLTQANAAASDATWLDLCVTAAELAGRLRESDALQAAIAEIARAYPRDYPGQELLDTAVRLRQRCVDQSKTRLDPADPASRQIGRELEQLRDRALVADNPLLAGREVLFVKRAAFDSDHYYDEFNAGIKRFGSSFCVLSVDRSTVRDIAPSLSSGLIDRYDLSFDARRILFDYKRPLPEGYRIFEMQVDGTNVRQITTPPTDEERRIATYAAYSPDELAKHPGRYGHWTDDMHPCYLPDGRIAFTSTRSERSVLCGGHSLTVTNLYRVNADGSGLTQLSQGALSEFCPSVMNDGRLLYNRWEYVDKGAGAVQSLWAMCPDGSRSEEVYGDNITTPGVFNQARNIPGHNNLVVCLGCGHCPGNIGAIVLVDMLKDKRTETAMTALTPGCISKGNWGMRQYRNDRWLTDIHGPWYCDPYPLSSPTDTEIGGKFFLVSCNPDGEWNDPTAYGIYLLDVFGNRVLVHREPDNSCWQARPLEPRPTPPILSDRPAPQVASGPEPATILLSDVYQGLDGVPRGRVKYVRVMEQVARPWSVNIGYQADDSSPGQMVAISLYTHLSVKVLHGVVPVHEDGSAYFTVPAHRNIFLEALDENYMEIQRMRTFVNFQPGEQRSCIGCHEQRNQAPANHRLLALNGPPVAPVAQPGEVAPRPLHYPTDVQPILDRHCVSCHGAQDPAGGLELTGTLTSLFNRSYENMIARDLVGYIQEFIGPKPEGADAMGYAPAVPPYTYGSHRSKLVQVLRQGHYDVQLTREEMISLTTWVDSNAPYYGSYFGRRNLSHREDRDFRPVPTLESALGVRPLE
jgi:hypothetical protein